MIQTYNKKNDWLHSSVVNMLKECNDSEFYITQNNSRIFIKSEKDLKKLFNQATDIYYSESNGDIDGIVVVWKSVMNANKRYYVKLAAKNKYIAKKLLTMLSWNSDKDLWVKINKRHSYLNEFQKQKYEFFGDRGSELLLKRLRTRKIIVNQRDKSDESNNK